MYLLGINIGSVSVKFVYLNNNSIIFNKLIAHEGNIIDAVNSVFNSYDFAPETKIMVTGNEGRFLLNVNNTPEINCIEEYLKKNPKNYSAVVSMGGEDIVVYICDKNQKIYDSISGSKCATGTGEFFKQQLGRMNMNLNVLKDTDFLENCKAQKLSKRCSVFMKSDCTHRLNKGQASKGDIVLSLCNVMASKISEYLKKARIINGKVLLSGGLSQNNYIINYLKELLPQVDFFVPENAKVMEAYGAALLAETQGSILPKMSNFFKSHNIGFKKYKGLKKLDDMVEYIPAHTSEVNKDSEYILGIDGGSTTTKVCLIDKNTKEIVAHYYNRTHGDPVNALLTCLKEVVKQVENRMSIEDLKICLISTTGSSRELLGVFTGTQAVYNEIMAHSRATAFYCDDVDTIFEIGGQDAKYIYLRNNVAVDYAMNEACSAGTGSFLEEAASGDLNITDVTQIGQIAEKSDNPIKFSEHCSAFINAEIRKAIVQGSQKEDITAGLVVSIVSNYLNRVVGNRNIGNKISVQGGVAKNSAIPLAFAMLLNKPLIIPPMPELLGCFGAGLIAMEKFEAGQTEKNTKTIKEILNTDFKIEKYITCKSCENLCSIAVINIDGNKKMFGGRCSKYSVINKSLTGKDGKNYIADYRTLLFKEIQDKQRNIIRKISVGIPLCFSVYSLYPLFNKFFSELGIDVVLSDKIEEDGVSRVESDYCFPAEIAHGAVLNIINKKTDYIFLPHFKEKFDNGDSADHSCTCPITQALPYYVQKAFPEIEEGKILSAEVSFNNSNQKNLITSFIKMANQMGFKSKEAKSAILNAIEYQNNFDKKLDEWGGQVLKEINKEKNPAILLIGRPYNAFTKDANMGIPDKFINKGLDVIPFNVIASGEKDIYDNMYWYYGRQVLKAVQIAKENKNLYPVYITNFSCAPDSFLLHYFGWIMKTKPFLILELDSHTADAGIDTRIDAFLDIVENHYNNKDIDVHIDDFDNGLRFISNGKRDLLINNIHNNAKIPVRNNPKVKMLLSNMGRYSTELVSVFTKQYGINTLAFPVADEFTAQTAKAICSGKECLPSHMVLGGFLQFVNSEDYKKDETYIFFVPTTTGPCRTGQYFVFYKKLISDLKLDNVVVFTSDSDNSYNELGKGFSKNAWWAILIADYIKDIENTLRVCAKDVDSALQIFENQWQKFVKSCETDKKNVLPELGNFAKNLANIPLKLNPGECKKVLIIGEIYVRRDDFAINELVNHFAQNGIICKISGISEWIYYCDYVRKTELFSNSQNGKKSINIFNKNYTGQLKWILEKRYKHNIENQIKKTLAASGLLIEFPDDMEHIMNNCRENFIQNELYSEISVSGGMAYTSLQDGYSGVINISPFACLIGRVIEGIVKPWARQNKKALISIEIDGNPLPLNTLNKIDAFTASVMR